MDNTCVQISTASHSRCGFCEFRVMALTAATHIRLMSAERVRTDIRVDDVDAYMVSWMANMCIKQSAICFFFLSWNCWFVSSVPSGGASKITHRICFKFRVRPNELTTKRKTNDANSVAFILNFWFYLPHFCRDCHFTVENECKLSCAAKWLNFWNVRTSPNARARYVWHVFKAIFKYAANTTLFLIIIRIRKIIIYDVDCHLLHCKISVNNLHLFIINFSDSIAATFEQVTFVFLDHLQFIGRSIRTIW